MVTKITYHLAETKAVELDRIYTDSASLRKGMGGTQREKYCWFLQGVISGLEALPARLSGSARVDEVGEYSNRSFPPIPTVEKRSIRFSSEILDPSRIQSK